MNVVAVLGHSMGKVKANYTSALLVFLTFFVLVGLLVFVKNEFSIPSHFGAFPLSVVLFLIMLCYLVAEKPKASKEDLNFHGTSFSTSYQPTRVPTFAPTKIPTIAKPMMRKEEIKTIQKKPPDNSIDIVKEVRQQAITFSDLSPKPNRPPTRPPLKTGVYFVHIIYPILFMQTCAKKHHVVFYMYFCSGCNS